MLNVDLAPSAIAERHIQDVRLQNLYSNYRFQRTPQTLIERVHRQQRTVISCPVPIITQLLLM